MKNISIFIIATSFSLLLFSCKDEPTKPPPSGTVNLSLDYAECKEVSLKLSFTDAEQPRGYALLRDGEQITSGTLGSIEISLVDTTVVPGHDYTYIAQRLNGSLAFDASSQLPVHSLDTTSHTIQWFVDTLGAQGVIRDVWVFDRNNAWAVGEIYLRDSTGKIDMSIPYGAAHWDGQKWSLFFLPAANPLGYNSKLIPDGIFAFSDTDLWFVSGGIHRFNGQQITKSYWINYFVGNPNPILSSGQSVDKLWGSSSSNLYGIGRGGAVVRYDGNMWSKITINTTVNLEDVYGFDASHVWSIGTNNSDAHSVILQYNGTQWAILYDSQTQPWQTAYGFSSLWTNNTRKLLVAGQTKTCNFNILNRTFGDPLPTGQTYISYRTRGINQNDIFVIGQNCEVTHYNGTIWHLYSNVVNGNRIDFSLRCIFPTQDFILIGGDYYFGYNSAPIVIRGYR